MNRSINIFLYITCLILSVVVNVGCKKFVAVDPPFTSTTAVAVFKNDATAIAALTGTYMRIGDAGRGSTLGFLSLPIDCGLYTDELLPTSTATNPTIINAYYSNELTSTIPSGWKIIYNHIFETNAAIEGLEAATTLNKAVKQQLRGEAYFLRAWLYFYLVNLYGDVPLALSTDYKVNMVLNRSVESKVYERLIADLLVAESALSETYLSSDLRTASQERVRPTKAVARALLARVYLQIKDYVNAELYAGKVIGNTNLYSLEPLNRVFLKNSQEAIWQMPSVRAGTEANTPEGRTFILSPTTNSFLGPPFQLTTHLLNSFEAGDERRAHWISYGKIGSSDLSIYFPFKYKIGNDPLPPTESSMLFRLGELYLIRAEALAMQNKVVEAQGDLDAIRFRAGLSKTLANDKASLLSATMQECRVELFLEGCHRFFDLKRWGKVNEVLSHIKTQWQPYDQFFPIPQEDIDKAPNLKQNPGYQ